MIHLILGILCILVGCINLWIYGHECGVKQERLPIQIHRNRHHVYARSFEDLSEFKVLENAHDTDVTLRGR